MPPYWLRTRSGSIAWGNVPQGSTVKHYVCVINSGTAPDAITLTGSPPAGYGTITSLVRKQAHHCSLVTRSALNWTGQYQSLQHLAQFQASPHPSLSHLSPEIDQFSEPMRKNR